MFWPCCYDFKGNLYSCTVTMQNDFKKQDKITEFSKFNEDCMK